MVVFWARRAVLVGGWLSDLQALRCLLKVADSTAFRRRLGTFHLYEALGYDDLNYMLALDAVALVGVARCARMKLGHAAKFAAWIKG